MASADWAYEEKYDARRMVAYKYGKAVRLVSRDVTDHTGRFPGLVAALQPLPAFSLILVFHAELVSGFTRRHVLKGEVDGHRLILPARRLADAGLTAWAEVLAPGYEGLVATDPASPYVGGRTLKWLKVKQPHYRQGERGWEPKGKS